MIRVIKRKVLPREVVLSTSATNESSSPKYNLLPIRILRAGSTNTSQRRCSALSSLNKKTSILAPVFFFVSVQTCRKKL
jgi:hypothetical protein